MKKIYTGALVAVLGLGSLASFAHNVSAQDTPNADKGAGSNAPMMHEDRGMDGEMRHGERNGPHGGMMMGDHRPGIMGAITAINGTALMVTSKGFGKENTTTVYTVDVANAKIEKNRAASSVSGLVVGDMVMVEGTVNGTAVAATSVHAGMMMKGHDGAGKDGKNRFSEGNNQPADQAKTAVGDTENPPKKGFFGRVGSFFGRVFGF